MKQIHIEVSEKIENIIKNRDLSLEITSENALKVYCNNDKSRTHLFFDIEHQQVELSYGIFKLCGYENTYTNLEDYHAVPFEVFRLYSPTFVDKIEPLLVMESLI